MGGSDRPDAAAADSTLASVANLLAITTDEELDRWGIDRLIEETPATRAKVAVANDGLLVPRTSNGGTTGLDHAIPVATTVPGSVFSNGEPCVIHDLADTRSTSAATHSDVTPSHRSMICAPIGNIGVLVGLASAPGAFDDRDVAVAQKISMLLVTAQERLLDSADAPVHNEQLLEDIRSIVSHDLQNKLSVICGRLELAKETGAPEHFRSCERAITGIAAIGELVATLSETGTPIRSVEPVSLDEIARMTFAAIDTTDATLEIRTPASVIADPNCLRQLLDNLFRNAIEHSETPVTIEVGTMPAGFYVADDGPGIDPRIREDACRPGFTTSPAHDGTGLAIIRHLAMAHGWTLEITESAAGGARIELCGVDWQTSA